MTATEKLRSMLDERGVEWWPDTYYKDTNTCWRIDGFEWRASERDGKLLIGGTYTKYLTPEDAIAVTVGRETCEWCKDGKTFDGQTVMMSNHGWQRILHCPNCGRKVVDE